LLQRFSFKNEDGFNASVHSSYVWLLIAFPVPFLASNHRACNHASVVKFMKIINLSCIEYYDNTWHFTHRDHSRMVISKLINSKSINKLIKPGLVIISIQLFNLLSKWQHFMMLWKPLKRKYELCSWTKKSWPSLPKVLNQVKHSILGFRISVRKVLGTWEKR
jgi:hypothetical protein